MKVTVYTTTVCPYCKMLKGYLTEKGILYSERLTDTDDAAWEEMMRESDGSLGVPFTVIEKDGEKIKILGFDKKRVDSALGL